MRRRACRSGRILPIVLCAASCSEAPQFLSTTVPTNTFDAAGPYTVTTVLRRGSLEGIELLFCTDPLCFGPLPSTAPPFHVVPMQAISAGLGEAAFRGELPGQPQGTQVAFYVRARGGGTVTDPATAEAKTGRRYYAFGVLRPSGPCRVDSDCGPGELCDEAKVCRAMLATCSTDDDCLAGFRCDGRCVIRDRHCAADVDCLLGERCNRFTASCVPRAPCADAAECPSGTTCDLTAKLCRASCARIDDCDSSEQCTMMRCAPRVPCKADSDCMLAGLVCELPGGVCRRKGARYCQACASDADCGDAEDFCILAPGKSTGSCAVACAKGACPAGSECKTDLDPPQCVPLGPCP